VMQILPNPLNNKFSILQISYNNSKLLNKILFLRKIVLPAFCNKIHPYWNNEALIFYQNKYYTLYEFDNHLII